MNKCLELLRKKTMAVTFNIQNYKLLTLSLPTEEIFHVHSQNRAVSNLPAVDFRSLPRGIQLPRPLNT